MRLTSSNLASSSVEMVSSWSQALRECLKRRSWSVTLSAELSKGDGEVFWFASDQRESVARRRDDSDACVYMVA